MNRLKIQKIFALFTGDEYEEKYDPLIDLAMAETAKLLREDAGEEDPRITFLCAAMANYRFRLMRCASDTGKYTYAGKVDEAGQQHKLEFAERMLKEYLTLCRDILKTGEFVFMGFSGKEQING